MFQKKKGNKSLMSEESKNVNDKKYFKIKNQYNND